MKKSTLLGAASLLLMIFAAAIVFGFEQGEFPPGTLPLGGNSTQYLRGDSTWQTLNTTAVPEGTNLYYTTARANAWFATQTTDNLAQGSTNKYFANSLVDAWLSGKNLTGILKYSGGALAAAVSGTDYAPATGTVTYALAGDGSGKFAQASVSGLLAGALPNNTTATTQSTTSGSVDNSTALANDQFVTGLMGGTPFSNGQFRGAELAPVFSSNYTIVHNGCTITEGSGTMTVTGTSTGANSFAPTSAIVPQANYLYRVQLVLPTFSAGQFTVSMGGVTEPAVCYNTTSGPGIYVFFILAANTNNLVVTMGTSGTQTLTFTSVSVKQVGSFPNPQFVFASNNGDTSPRTVYAPASAAGLSLMCEVTAAYSLYVKPVGSDVFYVGSSSYSNQLSLTAARQTYVMLFCIVNGAWDMLAHNGTVTPG